MSEFKILFLIVTYIFFSEYFAIMKKAFSFTLLNFTLILMLMVIAPSDFMNTNYINSNDNQKRDSKKSVVGFAFDDVIPIELFNGIRSSLNVNETANYYKDSPYTIGNGSITGFTPENISLFLDSTHDWQASQFNANITSIQDEQNWVANGQFGGTETINNVIRINQVFQNLPHPYNQNLNPNPSSPISTISAPGNDYMRIHFLDHRLDYLSDYVYLYNENNQIIDRFTGRFNLTTPWYNTSTIKICIDSDNNGFQEYGYYIDYFEILNGSLPFNAQSWTHYNTTDPYGLLYRQFGNATIMSNRSVYGLQILGYPYLSGYYYNANDTSAITQNFSIPRGEFVDAWISMDYYLSHGLESDDIYLFCKFNNETIYTRGFRTIGKLGKNQWHSTGLINIILWQNVSSIFNGLLNNQKFNISVGIQAARSVTYTGFEDGHMQEIFLDNIQLILRTKVNCTQVNLTLNENMVTPAEWNGWGNGFFEDISLWNINPVNFLLNTNVSKLFCTLNSILRGYHLAQTYSQPNINIGTNLHILSNGSILWDFYSNAYRPPDYGNYTFRISKPIDWNITAVNDPTNLQTAFEGGMMNQDFVQIPEDYAYYPGWWHFTAVSSNKLQINATSVWNKSVWVSYNDTTIQRLIFDVMDIFALRTKLDLSIPITDLLSTWVNLTIYDSANRLWYNESVHPLADGSIDFSNLTLGALNTTAGIYYYKVIWMNETSAGGFNGSFEIRHNITYKLLYPKDAEEDLFSEKIFGDVVSIRLFLNDSDNGIMISNAEVQLNWSDGMHVFSMIGGGIYEIVVDTNDLLEPGLYNITFRITCSGFYNQTFSMMLHVIQETDFSLFESDHGVELGKNYSLTVDYKTSNGYSGISNAMITLNISSSHYFVESPSVGRYHIVIDGTAFNRTGLYSIFINASKNDFESQIIIERVQIFPKEVQFNVLINKCDCTLNKSFFVKVGKMVDIQIQAKSSDGNIISNGNLTLKESEGLQLYSIFDQNTYNIQFNSSTLGMGIHYVSVIFQHADYVASSFTLQLRIDRLRLNPALYETNSTLIKYFGEDFTIQVYLEDEDSHLPLTKANISYVWSFGTGFMREIGNGVYIMNGSLPKQEGTFSIVLNIYSGDNYYSTTLTVTLIAQRAPINPQSIWWVVIPAAIILFALMAIVIKQNVIVPKKRRLLEVIEMRTQIFSDLDNLRGLMVIQKSSGLLMYNQVFGERAKMDDMVVTGFLQAISLFSTNISEEKPHDSSNPQTSNSIETLEFTHNNFNILIVNGNTVRVALILESRASEHLKSMTNQFLLEFEELFGEMMPSWDGNTDLFVNSSSNLVNRIFNLNLTRAYVLAAMPNRSDILHTIIKPNSVSETVFQYIDALVKEQGSFKLKMVLSLISPINRLEARRVILELISQGIIIVADDNIQKVQLIQNEIKKI